MNPPVLVALTARGGALARRLQAALPGALLHGLGPRVAGAEVAFEDTGAHLRRLFADRHPIVGICASGILIRALAPLLADKGEEPPVIALAEDGSAAVPLLGGHRGANQLARRIAGALGGTAAITTAGEIALGLALDDPPAGWRIANPGALKTLSAALLAGAEVALRVEAGEASWLTSRIEFARAAGLQIRVTERAVAGDERTLVFHPPVLALGVGGERGVEARELEALVRRTLAAGGLAPGALACVASIDLKEDEPAVHALAASLGVPARFFPATRLAQEAPRLKTPSAAVRRATGCPGVAEGAALAAAGPQAVLVAPKVKSARATCALALSPRPIDPFAVGRARARLAIVGIGPGDAGWRTPEASAALAAASDIVGYGLYLDLLGEEIAGKTRHTSALGEEEARVKTALGLAAEGRAVALVSSGDAGIYGLGALAFELIERAPAPAWRRIEVHVCPGVSAAQAAAARAGAPLGHDFCAISLSDLLTPWATIARRLEAASAADFVVALYNPASGRRRDQLARARDILLAHRAPDTPVVLARNVGRPGETVATVRLADLAAAAVDMLTLVLIGNSQTRRIEHAGGTFVYTPRGYAVKRGRRSS
ncbi:MAG: precorrin-3B C(17)-methyltransferase [Pseudomonadota bacterium]